MNYGALIEDLARRIEDEIAALDAGDHDALALATRAKLDALERVRGAVPEPAPGRDLLAQVADLNRAAAVRVNRARLRIERRLAFDARRRGSARLRIRCRWTTRDEVHAVRPEQAAET